MADWKKILKGAKEGFGAIPVVGSAISSVMGIFDGLFGKSDDEKYQDKLNADKAYQKEMIDYTNEANLLASQKSQAFNWHNYDSPAAKMQAYKDAGINPNQVAGQGYQLSGITASGSAPLSLYQLGITVTVSSDASLFFRMNSFISEERATTWSARR